MNTTSIFAEILVIGIHSLSSIFILYLAFYSDGTSSIKLIFSINFFIPILSFAYLLGIIVDRLSDSLLRPLDYKLRKEFSDEVCDLKKFSSMRYQLLAKTNEVSTLLEYTRSKLRIARSSILNFLLTTIAVVSLVNMRIIEDFPTMPRFGISFIVIIVGFGFIFLSYFTFKSLVKSYLKSIISAYKVTIIEKP